MQWHSPYSRNNDGEIADLRTLHPRCKINLRISKFAWLIPKPELFMKTLPAYPLSGRSIRMWLAVSNVQVQRWE